MFKNKSILCKQLKLTNQIRWYVNEYNTNTVTKMSYIIICQFQLCSILLYFALITLHIYKELKVVFS